MNEIQKFTLYRQYYFTLYRYLRRSIDVNLINVEARDFLNARVKSEFRRYRTCQDNVQCEALLERAHTVLMACQVEDQ